MTRLSEVQKAAVLKHRPAGAAMVRLGVEWGVVWHDPEARPVARWVGQLIKDVRKPTTAEMGRFVSAGVRIDEVDDLVIVWAGATAHARTRREIVAALAAEAMSS